MAQQRAQKSRWQRFLHTFYAYRGWWVDSPTISLLGLYHWHFYTHGFHAVPSEMPEFCWTVLIMYLIVKEKVRWERLGIMSRRGSILVGLWVASILEFFILMQWDGKIYSMPPQMIETTLIIIAGFIGILPIKYYFARKYPQAAGGFQTNQND